MSLDTPAAVIESGTLIRQRVHVATLRTIGSVAEEAAVCGPAVFVVGEIVRFREKLASLSGGLAHRAIENHPSTAGKPAANSGVPV
jgi:precorrin-4 methylase